MNLKKQDGDTIIEVLISIAIVGLVVASSYALASRALRQGITAAERVEALKLAEAQIENLKYRQQKSPSLAEWNNFVAVGTANNFCLDTAASDPSDSATWRPILNTGVNADNLITKAQASDGKGYDDVCNPAYASNGKYFINITIPSDPSDPNAANPTYLVKVRWNAVGGGQNQSQLYYRF